MRSAELCCRCGRLLNAISVRRYGRPQTGNTRKDSCASVRVQIGNREMKISTGELARSTAGSAFVEYGDTAVLGAVSMKKRPSLVGYRQKAEGPFRLSTCKNLGASVQEILISRSIDLSLRRLLTVKNLNEIQVVTDVFSSDGVNKPDTLAINAASAALALSPVSWLGPVGTVRVCVVNNRFIINPTLEEQRKSTLDLLVTAASGDRIVLLDGSADRVPCQIFLYAVKLGVAAIQPIIEAISDLQRQCGKSKQEYLPKTETTANVAKKDYYRLKTLKKGIRVDSRSLTEIRDVSFEVGLFKSFHGSVLVHYGKTQVICSAYSHPLDSLDLVSMATQDQQEKNFSLVYECPVYASDGIKKATVKKDMFQGYHIRNALRHVFPHNTPSFTRLSADVTEADGPPSMASVSGCCLALQQAGIQVREPVAGVTMGLIADMDPDNPEKIKDYALLTDINQGEDSGGDMDFEIAGTERGITAIQLKNKTRGIPLHVVTSALYEASDAICRIISIMNKKTLIEPYKAVPFIRKQ